MAVQYFVYSLLLLTCSAITFSFMREKNKFYLKYKSSQQPYLSIFSFENILKMDDVPFYVPK